MNAYLKETVYIMGRGFPPSQQVTEFMTNIITHQDYLGKMIEWNDEISIQGKQVYSKGIFYDSEGTPIEIFKQSLTHMSVAIISYVISGNAVPILTIDKGVIFKDDSNAMILSTETSLYKQSKNSTKITKANIPQYKWDYAASIPPNVVETVFDLDIGKKEKHPIPNLPKDTKVSANSTNRGKKGYKINVDGAIVNCSSYIDCAEKLGLTSGQFRGLIRNGVRGNMRVVVDD